MAARSVLLLALAVLAACGLSAGGPAESVSVPAPQSDPTRPGQTGGWREIDVYFVDGAHLEAVPRRTAAEGPQPAVDLLLAGPTRAEVASGLRTALSPQAVAVSAGPGDSRTVTVAVGRQFTAVSGGNQLLAVAQVVWTVTQFAQVDAVRFVLDGTLVEVPTDSGLSDGPVGRADYRSVAPRPGG